MGIKPIKIAVRFRPFSRRPGSSFLIPGTDVVETLYPTLCEHHSLNGTLIKSLPLDRNKTGIFLHQMNWERGGQNSRLSLGISKKQEVGSIRQRLDLKEILPLWFRLGGYYSDHSTISVDEESLLAKLLSEEDKEKVLERFCDLYLAGFSDGFVPRIEDLDHWGFLLPPTKGDPLAILVDGAKKIASLFVQERGEELHILPMLPSSFPCGRLIDFKVGLTSLSIEWTKGFLRQVQLLHTGERRPKLIFPKEVASFRCRNEGPHFVWDNFKH